MTTSAKKSDPPHGTGLGHLWRRNLAIWAAMVVLLLLSLSVAYVPLGAMNTPVAICFAMVMAGLVAGLFMELSGSRWLRGLTAFCGVVFVLVMFGLTLADVLTRQGGWTGLAPIAP
jgi:cytochrome c oxidase subunit 4